MSVGMVLLAAASVLIYLGVCQRVLDKMRMNDKSAILISAGMFFGGLLPNIRLGSVEINIGGALIPAAVGLYLIVTAGSVKESLRASIGTALTAAAVYLLGRFMPNEPESMMVDPNYVYGLGAGLIAYILGRSRRGAFVCGILGVLLADTATAIMNWQAGIQQPLVLGGGGVFDVAVLSALTAVILAELAGEIIERFKRRKEKPADINKTHENGEGDAE